MTPRGTAIAVAVTAAVLAAMPAAAQAPALTATMKLEMTPPKGGAQGKPKGIELSGSMRFDASDGQERPIITRGRILLPRGLELNGSRYPACLRETLIDKGPSACPKRSIIGSVSSSSFLDQPYPTPQAVLINGGPRRIWAYTTLYRPTLVKEAIAIRLAKPKSRQWSYELRFTTPANMRIVTGIPIVAPAPMTFSIGGRTSAKRYLTYDGSCPRSGSRRFVAIFDYWHDLDDTTGRATARGRLACR